MKYRNGLFILFALLGLILLVPAMVFADKTDRLIELLIEKDIVTAEEAAVLEQELEENEKPQLVSQKADAPEAAPVDWTKKVELKYDKGVVMRTTDDHFSVKLNGRVQGLFSYKDTDGGDSLSSFKVRRARILASGNAFYPWLKYGTQITLEGGGVSTRDVYLEATCYDWLKPRFGQFKVPFDREFLNIGFKLQLIDRSIASSEFSLQRDVGFQISGRKIFDVLEYDVGIFNGSGVNRSNVDGDYMYVGRLVWAPFGSYPYWEGAVDAPTEHRLAIGVGGAYMPGLEPGERATLAGRLGQDTIVPVESDVTQWTADFAYKLYGFSMKAGYYFRNIDPKAATLFGKQDAWGVYLQGGLFLISRHLEIAGRYAYVEPDNPNQVEYNEETEFTLGLNYYFAGHDIKTGINYSVFSTEAQPDNEDEHLLQASAMLLF